MKKFIFFLFIFFLTLTIYYLTSAGKTPYDYFIRLADAFIHGKYWLSENPPWLSELIPWDNNTKFFFVNPPMPAFLAVPFVFIFGKYFPQQYLAHILGAGGVILTILLAFRIKKDIKTAIWSGLLIGFGSIIWYLASTGSVWYLGQITAYFFLTTALLESLGSKRPFLVGLLLSGAYLSRLQIIFSLPLFAYLLSQKKFDLKIIVRLLLGVTPFLIIYSTYNYLRFGNLFENGYTLIPGILKEPWFNQGQFSFYYIPIHLKVFLLGLPKISDKYPYIWPSWAGMAIWITTPAFVYSLRAKIVENTVKLTWLTVLLIGLLNFSYGSIGFSQFGYRYAVDFYPFLMFLTIKGVARTGLKWHHWLLLIIGVVVNLWGVVWINKFGWVSF